MLLDIKQETIMSFENLSSDEAERLKTIVQTGVKTLEEVATLKESLSDSVTDVTEKLSVKKAFVNKLIRSAYKAQQKGGVEVVVQEQQSELDEIHAALVRLGVK